MISKTNTSFQPASTSCNHTQQSDTPIEVSSILEKDTVLTIKTNTSLPPATLLSMSTLLSKLHPRKYKRVEEMESEWCDKKHKKHKKLKKFGIR